MDALLAEPRIAGAARKEVLKCLPSLHDRRLRGVLGDLQHPRELLMLDRVQLAAQRGLSRLGKAIVLLPRCVLPPPFGQRPVVGEARGTRRFGEGGRLTVFGSSAILWAINRTFRR